MNRTRTRRSGVAFAAAGIAGALLLAACGGTSSNGTTARATSGAVLPVDANPITNTATAGGLHIDSVLVENNVDPTTGTDASDHLEIALSNIGTSELTGFEIYYTVADPTTGVTENYYAQLPADFAIPVGGTRVAHFDGTGAPDHFPVNTFGLFYTDTNALDVTVTVSANGVQTQTATVTKDEGGTEAAD